MDTESSRNHLNCGTYIQTTEKTSFSKIKDSCLKCGRTKKAHEPRQTEIKIWFGGRLWVFKNWEEAQKAGFYLG